MTQEALMNFVQSAVLENADLLREIAKYLEPKLPLILSFKSARQALRPKDTKEGQKWILSKKRYFAASVTMVEWAQAIGCEFETSGKHSIFCVGSFEVIEWAKPRYFEDFLWFSGYNLKNLSSTSVASAAQEGFLDFFKWMEANELSYVRKLVWFNHVICYNATKGGHLHVLKWLKSFNATYPDEFYSVCKESDVCLVAAKKGHLHILEWFRSQDLPCLLDVRCCTAAVYQGHLLILQWIKDQDTSHSLLNNSDICLKAAKKGHLSVLQFLRGLNPPCPWVKEECFESSNGLVKEWILTQDV